MPYSCSKCATTASQLIDVEQHYDILKFATPPEMKCATCKSPTVCVAPESLLSRLRTLPRVDIDSGLRKFVKEMRDRKPVQPQQPKQPGAAGTRLGMFTGLIVLALVAAAILIGVNWYQTREARETQKKIENVLGKVEGSQGAVQRDLPAGLDHLRHPAVVVLHRQREPAVLRRDLAVYGQPRGRPGQRQQRRDGGDGQLHRPQAGGPGLPAAGAADLRRHRARALSELEGVRGKAGGEEYQKALESVRASRKAVAEALVATGGAAAPTQQAAWYWEESTPS